MTDMRSLDCLFAPKKIAVIGASDNKARIGGRVLDYLLTQFPGQTYPVNPGRATVQGVPGYPTVADLPETPDLAIVAVRSEDVLSVVDQLGQRGTGAAIVFSSGFAETGDEGRHEQEEMHAIARKYGMRLLGPNCIGLVNRSEGLLATFAAISAPADEGGGVAIVSQSGAVGAFFWREVHRVGLGANYLCTTGNQSDVTAAEAVSHLIEQPDVKSVLLFLEGLPDPDVLLSAGLRALELGKPIVAMKSGFSAGGAAAAASHTGSAPSDDALVEALLERAGIVRAETPAELVYFSAAFAAGRFPTGNKLGIVTGSGGLGVVMADEAARAGLVLNRPSPSTEAKIRERIPPFGSSRNPIDYTANSVNDPTIFDSVVDTVLQEAGYDGVCISGISPTTSAERAAAVRDSVERNQKPALVHTADPEVVRYLIANGVPAFTDAPTMVRAMAALSEYARRLAQGSKPAPTLAVGRVDDAGAGTVLTEDASADRLSSFGIAASPSALPHEAVEFRLEATHDAQFGPITSVSLGGTLGELMTESAHALLPLRSGEAQRMLERLCRGRLTDGPAALTPGGVSQLADLIEQLSLTIDSGTGVTRATLNRVVISGAEVRAHGAEVTASA
ncbi:CoA-binding protein [Nocardioides sp. WS12]|uniref:acetate--CoA ligase family protein n=1 Tax=Nocardioides sp. WS12 TaxID=2486272 RepID=UPI0015FAEDAA|nr:CoA-binding protein [Nocardioides sp. WS12]